jgi:hypothetical protein
LEGLAATVEHERPVEIGEQEEQAGLGGGHRKLLTRHDDFMTYYELDEQRIALHCRLPS